MLTIVFYQSGDVMSTPWGGNFPVGTQYQLSKLVPAKITPGVSMEGMCPAWQFPDGVKFIYASYAGFASAGFFGPYYSLMNVFYNGADGKTRWGIYAVNNNDGLLAKVSGVQDEEFPGRSLDENSVILTAGASSYSVNPKNNYILYANGHEIRYEKKNEIYTKEQNHAMEMKPYTHSVNSYQITFTLEFKEFFVDQIRNHRKKAPQILKAAGYDPSWFTKGCKSSLRRRILEEADSERGHSPVWYEPYHR